MNAFTYSRCADGATPAVVTASHQTGSWFIAGGTTLLDLAKLRVIQPRHVLDVSRLPLRDIAETEQGGLRIGATVRNSALARDARVRARYPVLAEAILNGASAQIRNMATTAGNLLQRTRCPYFRDNLSPCNKRAPGSGCAARDGFNRSHAILGTSDACIAAHPSDMCVALSALDAVILAQQGDRLRRVAFEDFHLLPGGAPEKETVLSDGELITAVEIPELPAGTRSWYYKARDRSSYEFALASAAVVLRVAGGIVGEVRISLGGVGTKPWRCREAEAFLQGKSPTAENFNVAAGIALQPARVFRHNAFKRPLARHVIVHVLETLTLSQPAVREI